MFFGFNIKHNMDGHMDEIMMFSEALDAERVRRLWVLQL